MLHFVHQLVSNIVGLKFLPAIVEKDTDETVMLQVIKAKQYAERSLSTPWMAELMNGIAELAIIICE